MAFFTVSSLFAGALSDFSLGEAIFTTKRDLAQCCAPMFYGEIRRPLIKLHNMREYTGIHDLTIYSIAKTLNMLSHNYIVNKS